ncbi:membrane-bound alkaline phosphatase-like [Aricia agestis]|uniref:membrane-bound alkaline phosphatase-like n=1 Tax=Aricia agestis TaxID=91739 RepID=UPI001C201C10|nr:membrane-bound alkaline phosphatase-like [Aricia agestis]
MCNLLSLLCFVCTCVISSSRTIQDRKSHYHAKSSFDEKNKDHWRIQAQMTLLAKLDQSFNINVAKNVILFVGDGMSITTVAAARAYLGQQKGYLGEELKLSFESFPFTGLAKTYCVDSNVADSACSGTAYLSGVKANSGTVGLSAAVKRGDCRGQRDASHSVTGLMDWAQKSGKTTGLVTTTRVTHATPAAAYAHSADRKWEADTHMPKHGLRCEDIASQLVNGHVGSRIDVVLGGGRQNFLPNKVANGSEAGHRGDGRNLIQEWLQKRERLGAVPKYISTKEELLNIEDNYDSLLGLFSSDHMPYNLESNGEPSLADMTEAAIRILSKNKNGYFLFVEGGRIDTAHHETKARKALDETVEFAKAVEAATRLVDDQTLVVVTADHSHTMTYSGYSKRGSDILGLAKSKFNTSDYLPYTTLSYANGPGYKPHQDFHRHNLMLDDISNLNYTYPSLVPTARETHGGEDVAVFAQGPWAHLFTGSYEQNYLPHAIAYAACIGDGRLSCDN